VVEFKRKKDSEPIKGYYIKTGRSGGSITVKTHDGNKIVDSLGVQKLELFHKWSVGVLGDLHLVKKESRMPLSKPRSR